MPPFGRARYPLTVSHHQKSRPHPAVPRPLPILPVLALLLVPGLVFAAPAAAQETPETVSSDDLGERSEASFEFALAKLLVDEGDYRAAEKAFRRAVQLDPTAGYVRIEYAQFLSRLGRFGRTREERVEHLAEGVRQAEEAARLLPGNPDALQALADANLALSRQAPADPAPLAAGIAALEQLRETGSADVRSLLALGQIYQQRGEPGRAADIFQEVVTAAPGYEPVYGMLAETLLAADRLDEAIGALERVIAFDPTAEAARGVLAEILAERGEHERAVEVLRGAPEPLEDPVVRHRLAVELYILGELDEALALLDELAAEQPDDQSLHLLRGLVLSAQSKNTEALEALEPLLEDGVPGQSRLTAELLQADLLVASGRMDEALERLDRLVPEDVAAAPSAEAEIRGKRAELLARTGREDEAEALLDEVRGGPVPEVMAVVEGLQRAEAYALTVPVLEGLLDEEPESVTIHFFLGVARERSGDAEGAIRAFQDLLEIEPDFDAALNYLGYMWIERNQNLDEAIGLVERAVELDPDNGAYLDSLGWGYYQQGRYREARSELERAAELEEDATIFEHLGDVYRALGETEAARRAYRRALELEADDAATVVEKLDGLDIPR